MANEFKHKDPGTEITQAEYISASGDGHIFACQATGDILYASSTTVLKNLGKGAANTVLNMGGSCIPAWTASPSVTDLTIGGGCITLSAATDIDLLDDTASALSFDASGKTGIIDIVTTNCSEGVTMSGTLGVTGVLTASGGIELGHASDTTIARSGSGAITVEGNQVYLAGGTDVPVADGGTGASTLTDGGVLLGSGTGAITAMSVLSDGQMIVGDGSTDPVAESGATLRTSIGVGTGDSPQFTGLTLTGALTAGAASTISIDADSEFIGLKLTNQSDSADTNGFVSLAFDLEDTGGNAVDSGKISVKKEASFTDTASTQDSSMEFHTSLNGTLSEKMTLNSAGCLTLDGNIVVANGKGINFAANTCDESGAGCVSAEVLDDYEEGTWTPTLLDADLDQPGGLGYCATNTTGKYTKIGNRVFGYFRLKMANISCLDASDAARVGGLPFTPAASRPGSWNIVAGCGLSMTDQGFVTGQVVGGNASMLMSEWSATTGHANFTVGMMSADGDIEGVFQYEV